MPKTLPVPNQIEPLINTEPRIRREFHSNGGNTNNLRPRSWIRIPSIAYPYKTPRLTGLMGYGIQKQTEAHTFRSLNEESNFLLSFLEVPSKSQVASRKLRLTVYLHSKTFKLRTMYVDLVGSNRFQPVPEVGLDDIPGPQTTPPTRHRIY